MKSPLSVLFPLIMLANCQLALADAGKLFVLRDGSRIEGEFAGVSGGDYVIRSKSLGEVRVKAQDVISMSTLGAGEQGPRPAGKNTDYSSQIEGARQQLLSDPQSMAEIEALASDPQVLAALSDPSFLAAVNNRDPAAMEKSAAAHALLSNPKIMALVERMKAGSR